MTIPVNMQEVRGISGQTVLVAFSWFLVISLGAMPIADRMLGRPAELMGPGCVVFVVAIVSAIILREREPWIRLVLHIYGQIMIWLSLSCIAIAAMLLTAGGR